MTWTPERDATLRRLIEVDRLSYTQAARIIGCTKNAAIGRGYRIDVRSPSWVEDVRRAIASLELPRHTQRMGEGA